MRRDQLEHIIRASGAIVDDDTVIIVGSQAILASHATGLPETVTASIKADVVPVNDTSAARADLIDGSIGEGSMFQDSFGVYAQGVSESTAKLAPGWKNRLVPLANENTGGVTGLCLEINDIAASKLIAGRPHDVRFCKALIEAGLIDIELVRSRVEATDVDIAIRDLAVITLGTLSQ